MLEKMVIRGGRALRGDLPIRGAKNATLPILCAGLLGPGPTVITNVPDLMDVDSTLTLLRHLGVATDRDGDRITLDARDATGIEAPYDLVRKMRASVLVLGPLLARHGFARVSLPGGCAIGERPIDQHLKGLEALGAQITLEGGYVEAQASRLRGARIVLDMPTVTGTENLMMAASLAEGTTVIENAAREPEIVDLAKLLNAMGGRIAGAGSSEITIEGVDSLHGAEHRVIPDRIEMGTYLVAGAIAGGELRLVGGELGLLDAAVSKLRAAGVHVHQDGDAVTVRRDGPLQAVDIRTMPYPGFPTDMQAQFMALMCLAKGTSVFTETLFENRFQHVPELRRMGANITLHGNTASVRGGSRLTGASVMATDLRASASLVLAGLAAEGVTEVLRIYHLDRGYEGMDERLRGVGADVVRAPMYGGSSQS